MIEVTPYAAFHVITPGQARSLSAILLFQAPAPQPYLLKGLPALAVQHMKHGHLLMKIRRVQHAFRM